ncbi:MAG: Bax inhibitor-1/YccA family protein [Candidatus Thalassarchaeaceae archaeon]
MRSGNPALSDETFSSSSYQDKPWWDGFDIADESTTMSIEGTAEKTGILLTITILTALFTAFSMPESAPLMMLGFLGGFITAMIVIFSRSTNPVLICLYAAFEGMGLGGLTWFYESIPGLEGIGIVAAFITFAILGAMLTIYRMGLIHWDENTRIAITSAVLGIFVIYIVSIIASFVGYSLPIMEPGPWGIAFSLFVVGIASFCLAADFDFIERGVLSGSPKELEWRAAFGLMVTLIWLYVEILRLLAIIAASR